MLANERREARMQEALRMAVRSHAGRAITAALQRGCSEKGTSLRSGDSIYVIVIRDGCCGMDICSSGGVTCLINAHSGAKE